MRSVEAVDIGSEFDDFVEEIGGFTLPVGHCFRAVGVAGGELW